MPHSFGYRARTRSKFSKDFRKRGMPTLSKHLQVYKVGQYVDIKADAAVHKGMPYRFYHGKTGKVWNVSRHGVGVELLKPVSNRKVVKRIHVRFEHVSHSNCRAAFLRRVEANRKAQEEYKAAIKAGKEAVAPVCKRLPAQPKEGLIVKTDSVQTMTPAKYVNLF